VCRREHGGAGGGGGGALPLNHVSRVSLCEFLGAWGHLGWGGGGILVLNYVKNSHMVMSTLFVSEHGAPLGVGIVSLHNVIKWATLLTVSSERGLHGAGGGGGGNGGGGGGGGW
jgi:hypothetical protein